MSSEKTSIKSTSLNYKNFLKDHLRVHGHVTHYPFMFSFHPEFTCEHIRDFGECLKKSHSDFTNLKYSEQNGFCTLRIIDLKELFSTILV